MAQTVDVSIVIPVYNEAENLPPLFQRLTQTMDKETIPYEIIFTNDGSQDASLNILKEFFTARPDVVRIIDFYGNFGQHMAIVAGFEHCKGSTIVTLDADLQNPPEEIPKLLAKIREGHDCVGSYRATREDSFFRTYVSRIVNWFREQTTDIKMRDHGCMLRAYSRQIVDKIVQSGERSTFIPALAYKLSFNPEEVEVKHDPRAAGVSKYNLYQLIRLNFDLITGFSLLPLQIFTLFGMAVSALSGVLVGYMILRRLIVGPEAEGLFTLFAILFFLISVVITGIGIIGEYLGRIFQTLSLRPKYMIRDVLEKK
jgi:undecaprenyl-phosphate 4-deoxy-4-formamido-L-arabinose transferase